MIRRLAATATAVALLLVLAVPVLAGGWAAIVADNQATPAVEDQPTRIGFRVMQHGVTPAPWETATVHFTNASTGEAVDVIAVNDRDDGHFTATAVLPTAGNWSWEVTLKDLATDPMAVALPVRSLSGTIPVTAEVTAERDALAARLEAVEARASVPVLAVLTLAVLAGGTAGFAMAWLAGRPGPRVTAISPAPQGVDPA